MDFVSLELLLRGCWRLVKSEMEDVVILHFVVCLSWDKVISLQEVIHPNIARFSQQDSADGL